MTNELITNSTGWANTYRPLNLDTYVGNTIVKRKIENMISSGRVPHTLLLEGERGCGKTTLARIIAKALTCLEPSSDGTACDKCDHCKRMNEKYILHGEAPMSMNISEIDITHFRGIDDAKALIEKMRVKPVSNQKKIYILDEVQLATPQAQNAFLKISEEPSPYLYIIMCTTEPEKLIVPFKSRFTTLKIRRPSTQDVVNRMIEICKEENVAYDTSALITIANHYSRVPRECIKALETASVGGKVTYDKVVEELQLVSSSLYRKYFILLGTDIFETMQFIEDLYDKHQVDWYDFLSQLSDYTLDLFNMKLGMRLEKYTEDEYKEAKLLLGRYTAKDIGRFLGYIEDALKNKDNPRYALTMLTLKMGYADYLKPVTTSKVETEIQKEENKGVQKYVENKTQSKIERDKLAVRDESKVEDLLSIFGGEAEIVDVTIDDFKKQQEEKKRKQFNPDLFNED